MHTYSSSDTLSIFRCHSDAGTYLHVYLLGSWHVQEEELLTSEHQHGKLRQVETSEGTWKPENAYDIAIESTLPVMTRQNPGDEGGEKRARPKEVEPEPEEEAEQADGQDCREGVGGRMDSPLGLSLGSSCKRKQDWVCHDESKRMKTSGTCGNASLELGDFFVSCVVSCCGAPFPNVVGKIEASFQNIVGNAVQTKCGCYGGCCQQPASTLPYIMWTTLSALPLN